MEMNGYLTAGASTNYLPVVCYTVGVLICVIRLAPVMIRPPGSCWEEREGRCKAS